MADSIERIADEMDEAAGAYAGHHSSGTFRRLATRLRALSPAGGDWVMVSRAELVTWRAALSEEQAAYFPDTLQHIEDAASAIDALLAASPQQEPGAVREMSQADCPHKGAYSYRDGWATGWNDCRAAMLAASPRQEPGAEGLRDAISASLYELSLVGEGREHDEAVAHIEKRITSGQTLAGAGGDAMESWHSAMNDAGELFSNAPDDRFASRASRVLAWIKANRPATSAGTTGDDSEDAARYQWLREQNANLDNPDAWTITCCDFTDKEGPSRYWVGSDLDAAIDAAISAQETK